MNLSFSYRTIGQFHRSRAFSFPPAAFAIKFAKARKRANGTARRECFHFGNRAADLKEHETGILADGIGSLGLRRSQILPS